MNTPNKIQLRINVIMALIAEIENETKALFHEIYPELEKEIFAVIDTQDKKKLSQLIMKLEDDYQQIISGKQT